MELEGSESLTANREWVVYRTFTVRKVFTGIVASSREEALEKWQRGEGTLDEERTQNLDPVLDAVDVKG